MIEFFVYKIRIRFIIDEYLLCFGIKFVQWYQNLIFFFPPVQYMAYQIPSYIFLIQEYSKHILSGDNEAHKESTIQLLCLCVDTFLRALSPFMPYLSEELYQRMPVKDKAVSVCVARYPDTTKVRSSTDHHKSGYMYILQGS